MKKKYENLQDEMFIAKCDIYTDYIDNKKKKQFTNKVKNIIKHLAPNFIFATSFLLTENPLFIYGIILYENTILINNMIQKHKNSDIKKNRKLGKIINFTDIKENIINKMTKKNQASYTEFSDDFDEPQNEESKKYDKALKQQNLTLLKKYNNHGQSIILNMTTQNVSTPLSLSKNTLQQKRHNIKYENSLRKQKKKHEQNITSQKEAIIEIFEEIEMHKMSYKIPPIFINRSEWHSFFDTIYQYLETKNKTKYFYEDARYIIRYTLVKAIIKKTRFIVFEDIIDNIDYLNHRGYTKTEIEYLKKSLAYEPQEKVLTLNRCIK